MYTKNNTTIICTFIIHQNALHDDTLVTSNFRLWFSHPLVDSNSAGSDSFFPFLNTELFSFHCAINVEFDAEESERCLNGCRRITRSYWNRYYLLYDQIMTYKTKGNALRVRGFYVIYCVFTCCLFTNFPGDSFVNVFEHSFMYL